MQTRKLMLLLSVCLVGMTMAFAANPNIGAWKLNEAKSKFPPGSPKNTMVVYEAVGDSIKVTVDGVDAKGKPTHNEWTGKFDGKDYPLMGDPSADTRSYKLVDAHTTDLVNKKDGKATLTGRIVISADGKSRTITVTGTDAMGMKVKYVGFYDKQ